jgi:3',5'-cyclic AMP phosphodiesterase CpdA
MFVLAHLSDVHLAPLPAVTPERLRGKRYFGHQSWLRRRHTVHLRSIADAMRDDIRALAPDHVAITGDLINVALEEEFVQAKSWLDGFGTPDWISVIPGNHDAYVPIPWDTGIGLWRDYMTSDPDPLLDGITGEEPFPFYRRRGDVAIIGLSTAVPTPFFSARGRLGGPQLRALDTMLARLRDQNLFRVLLIHHPPLPGQNEWRKAMGDTRAFIDVVRRRGADLVLHGHNHRQMRAAIRAEGREVPVLGVASASARLSRRQPAAHYNICRIARVGNRWSCEVEARRWEDAEKSFVPAGRPPA